MSAEEIAEQPYEVVCDASDRDGWLDARQTGIGASDWRLSPMTLWARKRGVIEDEDLSGDERVHWGNVHEPTIIEQYSTDRYAGRKVWDGGVLLRNHIHRWALATLDAWTLHPEHGWIPLEVKTTGAERADDWAEGVPDYYLTQLDQQMLVTGAPAASMACLIGGNQLVWDDVPRDEERIAALIEAGAEMWRRIEEDDPPPPSDAAALGVVKRMYPEPEAGKVAELGPDAEDLDAELQAAKADIKEAEARKNAAEAKLRALIGDAEAATLPSGASYTLKLQHRKETVMPASSFRVLRRKGG